jgi:hypothetical protein
LETNTPLIGVNVCWNVDNIWESKIPIKLSTLKRRVEFEKLPTIWHANKVLFEGTYWFKRLIAPDKGVGQTHGRNGVAILRLLAGLPSFSGKERVDQLVKMRLVPAQVNKLRQVLALVDGLLMQLILSFPDYPEICNWSFMDRVTHSLISCAIADYFRDESDEKNARLTTFEKVKKVRGDLKERGFNPSNTLNGLDIPQEMSYYRLVRSLLCKEGVTPLRTYRVATLCQTRASGTPPKSVYYKTLNKIVTILKEPSDLRLYNSVKGTLQKAVDNVYFDLLENIGGVKRREVFFNSCVSAAKISLSDSGEFFTKAENGGKLEAARKVLSSIERLEVINLASGEKTGKWLEHTGSNQGEMLFLWACHQFLDRKECYNRNIMSVRISLVAELGKYRAITVSHLAHAVLLHVLSHVLLEFLKGIPSSNSGVGAANHAWNFFKRLSHKNPSANFIFGDEDKYLFSTDWEQATDFCDHYIAQSILNRFCHLLGVPVWYRETCVFAVCAPRQVETLDRESKVLEMFLTERGELMGDPVVKFILHAYHLVTRESARMLIMAAKRPA